MPFFRKKQADVSAKANSIIVNGVEYTAPESGICSIKVDNGKVFINGKDATERIASTAIDTSHKSFEGGKQISFENLNVTFKSDSPYIDISEPRDNRIVSETPINVDIDIPCNNFMPVNISSNGDVNVKGNIKGRVYITGDFTVEGTYDCRHNMENHKSYANSFSLKNYIGEGDYYIETGSGVDIDNNAKGDIYFDSTDNYDSIVIGGNFKGNIIDIRKETADDDGSVDIEVKGYAEGNIQNNSEGDIKIGFGDD